MIKHYNIGELYLAKSKMHYIHRLPLLTFGDVMSQICLDLYVNSERTGEAWMFNVKDSVKFNLQKRLLVTTDGITSLSIEEENGAQTYCENVSFGNTHFVANDNTGRIVRKTIVDGYEKYVLEYPDMSKEIYSLDGRIECVNDKYGNLLLEYEYETANNNAIKSITYRGNKKIVFERDETTEIVPNSIKYVVNDEEVCETTIDWSNGLINIAHYSGANYLIDASHELYVAQIMEGANVVEKLECRRSGDEMIFTSVKDGVVDTTTYKAMHYTDLYSFDMIDITDRNGVKTRVQYDKGRPMYSYEWTGYDNDTFSANGYFDRVVNVCVDDKLMGLISPNQGNYMSTVDSAQDNRYYYGSSAEMSGPHNVIISGWVKAMSEDVKNFEMHVDGRGVLPKVNIIETGIWQFFAHSFDNSTQSVEVYCLDNVEFKDVRITIKKKKATAIEYYLTNNDTELSVSEMRFGTMNGQLIEKGEVSGKDLVRHFVGKIRGDHPNEFYYTQDGLTPTLIQNASNVVVYVDGESHNLSEYSLVQRIYYGSTYEEIKYDFSKTDGTFDLLYFSSDGTLDKTETVNKQLDLVSVVEPYTTINYNRNTNGLIASIVQEGGPNNVTYVYDANYTKLNRVTDGFGSVDYTMDDVWGFMTKSAIPQSGIVKTETTFDMTADGEYLQSVTFGKNTEKTTNTINYAVGKISQLSSSGVSYNIENYMPTSITVWKNNALIKGYVYSNDLKTVNEETYGETSTMYTKTRSVDDYGRLVNKDGYISNIYGVTPKFINGTHNYGANNGSAVLAQQTDEISNETTKYGYEEDVIKEVVTYKNNATVKETTYEHDDNDRILTETFEYKQNWTKSSTMTIGYAEAPNSWKTDNRVSSFKHKDTGGNVMTTTQTYDVHHRPKNKTNSAGGVAHKRDIVYNGAKIESVEHGLKRNSVNTQIHNVAYTYDVLGRIESETDSVTEKAKSYKYDAVGRLVRENNEELGKSYAYTYDAVGNVNTRQEYPYKTTMLMSADMLSQDTFAYDTTHPDRLVSYNGKPITYDYQGNLRSYDGKTYSWTKGRLSRIEVGTGEFSLGTKNWQFLYNGYGQRVKKIYTYAPAPNETTTDEYITSETTSYIYDHSGRLVEESTTTIKNTGTTSTSQTEYIYDHEGIIGARYNNALYYFKRNLQGDVIEVYSGAGIKQTTFTYDAYGRCTVGGNTFIANRFKIRYRGYYYDTETGLYWVQTRYYNPDWCRWISPDSISYLDPETPHGLNLYLYCANDPINHYDPSGHETKWWQWALFGIGMTLVAVAAGMAIIGTGGIAAFGTGALIGSLSLGTVGAAVGGVIGYANDGLDGILGGILAGFGIGAIIGFAIGGGVGHGVYSSQVGTTYSGVGKLVKNPKINWSSSRFPHVGQRMAERKISSKLIGKTLKNGYAFMQTPDKYLIVGRKAAVVITSVGEVITTWAANNYDSNLMDVLRSIFGF